MSGGELRYSITRMGSISGRVGVRSAAVALILVGAGGSLIGCTATPSPAVREQAPCTDAVSASIVQHGTDFGVDRSVDAGTEIPVLGGLKKAPAPSCAFLGESADAPYAGVWVLGDAALADDIFTTLVDQATAAGLPLASKIDDTDSAANFLHVGGDDASYRLVIRTVNKGSEAIGLGAKESDHLVVVSVTQGDDVHPG